MGKVELIDDIMAPRDAIVIKFEGRNPFAPMTMVPKLLRYVLKVSSKDIKEPDIRWEAEGDKRKFYGKWVGKRSEDRWSTTRLRIIIQGEMSSKERTGWCNIEIKGVLLTNYDYGNFVQRIFWFFYNKTFQRTTYTRSATVCRKRLESR
jgi:hypothetical protein